MEKYDEQYLEVDQCINQSNSMKDSLACYEYLYELKFRVPKEIYAFYFRKLLNMNTGNISNEPRWKMFEGVDPEDIMYQDELDAINNEFKDCITVYRGASKVKMFREFVGYDISGWLNIHFTEAGYLRRKYRKPPFYYT